MFNRGVKIVIAVSVLYAVFLGSAADEEFAATTEPVTPSPGSRRCPAVEGIADTCVCNDGGGKIDLNPLSNTDGTPRYATSNSVSLRNTNVCRYVGPIFSVNRRERGAPRHRVLLFSCSLSHTCI